MSLFQVLCVFQILCTRIETLSYYLQSKIVAYSDIGPRFNLHYNFLYKMENIHKSN